MRSQKLILGVILGSLLLTGCGNDKKTLSCVKNDDSGNLQMKVEYQKDQVLKQTLEMKIEQENEENAKLAKERVDELIGSQYKNQSQTTYESKVEGKNVVVTLTIDVENLTEQEKESLKIYDSFKEEKDSLLDDGFTCE